MFEQKARIKDVSRSMSGECVVSIVIPPSAASAAADYMGKDLRVRVCEWKDKRSRDANAYFWELCGQLSAKLQIPPESIYRELIKGVGGNYEIVPIRNDAVETWIRNWESRGVGWVCQTVPSKLEGYTNVFSYYGSSVYDTGQMHRLIELLIAECKNNGVEYETPERLSILGGIF